MRQGDEAHLKSRRWGKDGRDFLPTRNPPHLLEETRVEIDNGHSEYLQVVQVQTTQSSKGILASVGLAVNRYNPSSTTRAKAGWRRAQKAGMAARASGECRRPRGFVIQTLSARSGPTGMD